MELHAPARVAEAERLCARLAARKLDRARREPIGVVVPLQRLERAGQRAENRVRGSVIGELDAVPADLGTARKRSNRGTCRPREQLDAETHAEHGRVPVEQLLQPHRLFREPRVVDVLVGVHRAPEDEHGVVRIERPRRRRAPHEAPFVE